MPKTQTVQSPQGQIALNAPTAKTLTWGFRASAALLLTGVVLSAIQGEELHTSIESIPAVVEEILDGDGAGVVALGILVMIITPIVATLSVVVSCVRIGDRRYALVTAAVLIILFVSTAIAAL